MTHTKPIDAAIAACRGADGTVDARALSAALATPVRATEAPARSLAEIGRDAARKAQREALLATLEACGWRLTEASLALGMGDGTGNILRAIRGLGLLPELDEARASGKVKRGAASHRQRIASCLTHSDGHGKVGA